LTARVKTRLALVLMALLMACATAPPAPAPTSGKPAREGSFTEAIVGIPGYLNPLYTDEDNSREIASLIYQGLVRVGADQQPEPLLAKEVSISADRLTYSVLLRSGLQWADGTPFTADDVVFTFGVLQDPAYDQPQGSLWKGVTVKKTFEDRVDFTLRSPSAAFPFSLRVGILPKHLFSGDVAAIPTSAYSGRRALGTGPFMVDSISTDRSQVVLRRNPNADPAPWLDRVVFRSYASYGQAARAVAAGEADAVGGIAAPDLLGRLRQPGIEIHDLPTFSFTSVFLNLTPEVAYFASPAVRRALAQGVDRSLIVREVLGGRADPQQGPIPPSNWAYAPDSVGADYNPAAAARALDEAGWTLPDEVIYRTRAGRDFGVSLVAADAYPFKQVAEEVRRQLRRIGVQVKVEVVPISMLVSRYLLGRTYQMAIATFDNGPDPDQFSLWHSSQKRYPFNVSGLPKQGFIDRDLEEGRTKTDPRARLPVYADLQRLISDAAPAIFLFEPHYQYAVRQRVRGVHTNPAIDPGDRFEYITDWYVSTR
jgi:peptide/nickel transport system substrate-binding protein